MVSYRSHELEIRGYEKPTVEATLRVKRRGSASNSSVPWTVGTFQPRISNPWLFFFLPTDVMKCNTIFPTGQNTAKILGIFDAQKIPSIVTDKPINRTLTGEIMPQTD